MFQSQPHFSRKMVWYSLTKFGIIKTWLKQYSMDQKIRFIVFLYFKKNLLETAIYRESFREVLTFVSFSEKNGFVFVDQIWHSKGLNQYSMTQKIRFTIFTDFKTNLQKTLIYPESFLEDSTFASLSQKNGFVFIEQILQSFESLTNIQSHRRFDSGFWQISEQVYRKLQYGEKIFAKF